MEDSEARKIADKFANKKQVLYVCAIFDNQTNWYDAVTVLPEPVYYMRAVKQQVNRPENPYKGYENAFDVVCLGHIENGQLIPNRFLLCKMESLVEKKLDAEQLKLIPEQQKKN